MHNDKQNNKTASSMNPYYTYPVPENKIKERLGQISDGDLYCPFNKGTLKDGKNKNIKTNNRLIPCL